MGEDKKERPSPEDAEIEREIRLGRKFTLAEAIGRIGGKSMLKGASPVTRKRQAEFEIEQCLESHLVDADGALEVVLLRRVRESEMLFKMGYDQPLDVLARFCERILRSEGLLQDFVRDVDAEWGRIYLERPHFQKPGHPPDPDDQYTFSSVRIALSGLMAKLRGK
ncbi:MAG TPA: hypothetical protein ENH84_07550 [Phycisphaerae bacterium]|nr:hypothetical protein [Phycisphaerae bacterium]